MTSDYCILKFLQHSVDGKNLMRAQSETLKSIGGSVDGD